MPVDEEFDVIIVGAGPSGSSCASFSAMNGLKVLLLDKEKFPRDKTCGDAQSGKTMKIIKELGLKKEIEKVQHAKTFGVILSSPKGDILNIKYPQSKKAERSYGFVCKRILFDNIIFQKAKSLAAKTIEGFTVTDFLKEDNVIKGVKGKTKEGKELEFKGKIVVGADGAHSVIASKLGFSNKQPKHYILSVRAYYSNIKNLSNSIEIHFLKSFMPGYFWIFPVGNNEANVGAGMILSDIKKKNLNLRKEMFRVIKEEPILKERFKNAKIIENSFKGWSLPVGSYHQKNYADNALLLGDAASLIDPFTGEGMGNGMLSGKIAAEIIKKAVKENDFSAKTLSEYDKLLWKEIGSELKTSYLMQRLGKMQFLLNWLLGKASRKKEVAELISSTLTNEESKKEYVSPLFYLKLLFK